MNRPVKRLLALAGSATIGVFATVALATPAQAHHPVVSGEADCIAGKYNITWTVGHTTDNDRRMKIVEITPADTVSGLAVGQFIEAGATATGTQQVDGTVNKSSIKLKIKGKWYEEGTTTPSNVSETYHEGTVTDWGQDACTPPPAAPDPTATSRNDCDGTIKVTITNTHTAAVNVTVTGLDAPISVPAGAANAVTVTVPAGTAGPIQVKKGDKVLKEIPAWTRPADCPKPASIGESTCTTFKVSITNPQRGQSTEATVTYGTQVKKVTVAPGKTEVVDLTPSSETEAVVTYTGWADYSEKVKYEKPANCAGLPQTGASTSTYIGSGIGLALLGFFAVYFGRRRLARLRRMAA